MNRIEEIENRMAAIADELENDGVDIDALEAEVRSLNAEKKQLYMKRMKNWGRSFTSPEKAAVTSPMPVRWRISSPTCPRTAGSCTAP